MGVRTTKAYVYYTTKIYVSEPEIDELPQPVTAYKNGQILGPGPDLTAADT